MKSIRLSSLVLVCLAMASSAAADVTFKQKASGKGLMGAVAGELTQQVKGTKMRSDRTTGGDATSTIIDAGARQMIALNHAKREATLIDMAGITQALEKAGVTDIKATITPTTVTRQIAGSSCTVHEVKVTVPMKMANTAMSMVMSGPYCLVKNGPGQADFEAFYRAAAENGLMLDPNQAKSQPEAARAMTHMYRQMAALGVPFAAETNIAFEGDGPMAAVMGKMGNNAMTTEVVSVSTAALPDSLFEVPAGYKVNKR
jgi:hypothetical protein